MPFQAAARSLDSEQHDQLLQNVMRRIAPVLEFFERYLVYHLHMVLSIVAAAFIFFGIRGWDKCPAERFLPMLLVAWGTLCIISFCRHHAVFLANYLENPPESSAERSVCSRRIDRLLIIAMLMLFLAGFGLSIHFVLLSDYNTKPPEIAPTFCWEEVAWAGQCFFIINIVLITFSVTACIYTNCCRNSVDDTNDRWV